MIRIVGNGPAVETLDAVVSTASETERGKHLDGATLGVVVGRSGDERFSKADETASEQNIPWVAVEVGGVGGVGVVDGAVSLFDSQTTTYEDLQLRVRANHDETQTRDISTATEQLAGSIAGYELTQLLAGNDVLNRVVVLPYDERLLLPVPGSDRDRTLHREYVTRPVEESIARAEGALDEFVGLINEVGEAESFPVPYYLAQSCETEGFSDVSAAKQAAGVDSDWNRAFMKALGEGLERYCAGVYRTNEFDVATPDELENAVSPSDFVCETDAAGEAIPWVDGENLQTESTVQLPAEFVHYPPPERRYRPAVTTGLGFGNSGIEAMLSGLYEVIERDATMLAWYSTFEPMGLDTADETVKTLEARAESEGLDVALLLVTMDIDVPVVVAAVTRDEWPRLALGSGASLDIGRASRSALSEALQNWMELRGMGPENAADASGAIGEYATNPDPAAEFITPSVTVSAEDLVEKPSTGEAAFVAVCNRLESVGLSAYAARTTTPDVEMLGFEAVRALVPKAQPLCFGEMIFGERAKTVPESMGFEAQLEKPHHPFP